MNPRPQQEVTTPTTAASHQARVAESAARVGVASIHSHGELLAFPEAMQIAEQVRYCLDALGEEGC